MDRSHELPGASLDATAFFRARVHLRSRDGRCFTAGVAPASREGLPGGGWIMIRIAHFCPRCFRPREQSITSHRITPSWVIPAGAWVHVKGAIYSTPVDQRPAYVFRGAYPIHPPGERGKIYSVDDMFPNSSFVDGSTLHVWLEDGSDPSKSNPLIDELRGLDPGNPDDLARWLPHVEGRPSGIHADGVRINGPSAPPAPHHLVFRNLEIHHFLGMGFSGGGDDLQFIDNHVYDLGRPRSGYGWYTSGDRHVYRGNTVHDTIFGFHLYSEGGKRPLRDSIIEHNVIHHNGGVRYYHMSSRKVPRGGAGLLVIPGERNIIRHNLVINNGADGIRNTSNDTTVARNPLHGNRGQPIRSDGRNTVIRDNVFRRPAADAR